MSRRWKEIKEDPSGLPEYSDRARQMQDSQNEKSMVDKPESKQSKNHQKIAKFVDTDPDDSDDEQEPTSKQLKKSSKAPEFVDTDSGDSDNEQEPT